MTVKIDKGVPVPPAKKGGSVCRWPWHDMSPGDSFFAAGYIQSMRQRTKKKERLMVPAAMGPRTVPGSTWTCRATTEDGVRGVRVWRVT